MFERINWLGTGQRRLWGSKCEKLRVSRTSPLIPYLPTCERTSTCDVMGPPRADILPTGTDRSISSAWVRIDKHTHMGPRCWGLSVKRGSVDSGQDVLADHDLKLQP